MRKSTHRPVRSEKEDMSRDIIDLLLESGLMKGVPKDALQFIADPPEWVHLKRGDTLIEQGDAGEAYYLLVQGRLRMLVTAANGEVSKAGDILAGDGVGQMSLFAEEPASSSVLATQDSDLIRFSARSYIEFMANSPGAAIGVAQGLIKRLHGGLNSAKKTLPFPSITVCPIDAAVDTTKYVDALMMQLGAHATAAKITVGDLDQNLREKIQRNQPPGPEETQAIATVFRDLQKQYDLVIFQLDFEATEWNRICGRYSDYYQFVTTVDGEVAQTQNERAAMEGLDELLRPRADLVVLHGPDFTPHCGAQKWLCHREITQILHLRDGSDADFARLARFVTGNSIGLVLGSGGARGLSHIGVLRALEEAGTPVDIVCGTSMGSIIAAGHAMDDSIDQITETNRRVWVQGRPTTDYTYPAIALVRGKRLHNMIHKELGGWQIEDLRLPFFCLSGDLTNTELVCHDRGPLWEAVRASGSIPGLGPPLFQNGRLLVDGATINGTPVDIFQERFGGICILVDVSKQAALSIPTDIDNVPSGWTILWRRWWPFARSMHLPGMTDIFFSSVFLSSDRLTKANIERADHLISPPTSEIGLLQFDALDALVEIGYGETVRKFPEMARGPLESYINLGKLPDIAQLPTAASLVANYKASASERRRWHRAIARSLILAAAAGLAGAVFGGVSGGVLTSMATFVIVLGVLGTAQILARKRKAS
jgi:predicted acylesterase/phospholipase RssA/CRP-like cAMP-binding protein